MLVLPQLPSDAKIVFRIKNKKKYNQENYVIFFCNNYCIYSQIEIIGLNTKKKIKKIVLKK
jgi:hypothetical protein